jgi:hydrophobe/amphiphile efflux-1 (HAE1) family protein
MNVGRLSIEQPVLAIVLSIFVLIIGSLAYVGLPISEYPEVAPPTVVVSATYPGASAQTVADTVATPIEQEINGVEDMMYLYSQATSDGRLTLTVTFKLGTDLDKAQVLVQNRVAIAEPRLPEEVRRTGVVTRKNSPDLMMVVFLRSPDDTYDQLYISNYALRRVRDTLLRLDGVGDINMFGARDYSMRIWLDPDKLSTLGLTGADVVAAVQAQNTQVAGGTIAEPPISDRAFQPNLVFTGRLSNPEDFEKIVVKSGAEGRIVRLKDVARIELGALSYSTNSYLSRKPAVALAIAQRPGSNALATADRIKATMAKMARDFPKGLEYDIAYNPTDFIAESVSELIKTIYEAVLIVIGVVIVFLQRWRAALIPILAIPVSLIGTFAVMAALGFSINNLSLFGLVLAVGIVVDDAIVVVENVERHLADGMLPKDAALKTMDEVGGALFSIALVLCAVFVPTAFLDGLSGQFFRQFAVTIAVATAISLFCSLTLSPALASLILRRHGGSRTADHGSLDPRKPLRTAAPLAPIQAFFDAFNAGFDRLGLAYGRFVAAILTKQGLMLLLYVGLIGATGVLLTITPKGFIPVQDRGYLIVAIQLPGGASLARTTEVVKKVEDIVLTTPGIERAPTFAGFSGATRTNAPNVAAIFTRFEDWPHRAGRGLTSEKIAASLRQRLGGIDEAFILVISPPAVPGIGTGGGFAMRIQDRGGRGTDMLAAATNDVINAARAVPGLVGVFSPFSTNTPQLFVEVDRARAQMLSVPVSNVTKAIETYFGSSYVNDFNILDRTYRVIAQADSEFRKSPDDLLRLRTRNNNGQMVPLGSLIRIEDRTGPDRVPRYNLYPAAEISGEILPFLSSSAAIAELERIARDVLPDGMTFEWTDLSYQQTTQGNAGLVIFPLCVLFVYLVLAAQYGSWILPSSILLIVPMCILAATLGVQFMGQDVNILTQIGFLVLVGLAAKNAILIVEFAKQMEDESGVDSIHAVLAACRIRLRPILMTSFAFILGVVPLLLSEGAGSEMRRAVGTAVFFGMLGVTFFGLVFTPIFYVVIRKFMGRSPAPVKTPA